MSKHAVVQAAELELLESSTRSKPARMEELLHPAFVEIGRSGRHWTRAEVIEALAVEPMRAAPEADEWDFVELAEHLVLVTYRIRSGVRRSRHASVWDTSAAAARLRYHQGTVIPPQFQ
ncbi:nuclear transport factor 2 family protein [Arthrobacter sp. ATA002]|uniref:nuclear transport factor 2 family protein n=1 Tax=Arthrobacter sp. ATA002 TaxID=2991715 RepID=UPI0022A75D0F|nr:nuclear transport factor 2 family protein [Arthrobacter sp. ATA002]WAP52189.1 nuclear transport factor 2 family protein [Arthrobacter sp. ATA002]